ncbi:MAG: hypothetical protein JWL66_1126 [Sphingomonadales bacterium]|nr:hypothetical protein [Sphingomonadales bacterium]
MRFLLLLSALLSAMVGSGAYARPALALTHQVGGLEGVQAPKIAGAVRAMRPVAGLPRVVDRLAGDGLVGSVAVLPVDVPIYSMRLRV